MIKELMTKKQALSAVAQKGEKHSATFVYMMMLIVYFPVLFYLRNFKEDSIVGYVVPLLFLFAMEGYLLLHLFLKRTLLNRTCKKLLLLFFIATFVSYCMMGAGLERILGLHIILMSMLLYRIYPIKKRERNTLYIWFGIAVAIILADNILDGKINTNTSGFLLSVFFCVSLARYFQTKNEWYLILSAAGFMLQIMFASRTAMFGSLLFLLLVLCMRKKHFSSRMVFWSLLVLIALGILLAWFYSEILFPRVGRGTMIIFGKDLFTGRENIWHHTFNSIFENFWFGAGSRINEDLIKSGYDIIYSNVHNQPIGMLASFGIVSFISFYVTFAYIISCPYRAKRTMSAIPAIFMMVIFVMCYLETYFFVQVQWLAVILSYGLLSKSQDAIHRKK